MSEKLSISPESQLIADRLIGITKHEYVNTLEVNADFEAIKTAFLVTELLTIDKNNSNPDGLTTAALEQAATNITSDLFLRAQNRGCLNQVLNTFNNARTILSDSSGNLSEIKSAIAPIMGPTKNTE